VIGADGGLRALQLEVACLIPVIRIQHEPEYVLVTLTGDIDFAAVTVLRDRLFASAGTGLPVVADLDGVTFIDAAGLGVLAGAARRAGLHGARLHVVCARRQTRRLFRLTRLDRVVVLSGSLDEALQLLPVEEGTLATAVAV
jgi:anti-sigma B factor antagonist